MKRMKKALLAGAVLLTVVLLNSCIKDALVIPDPGDMTDYRGNNGISYQIRLTGTNDGSVWGGLAGIYTDDSDLSTAAVHAGVVALDETKVVTVIVRPGQESYVGSEANGITTSDYGSWDGSYEFAAE